MRRRRTLAPEEEELWQTVARTARPLHEHPMFQPPAAPPPAEPPFAAPVRPRLAPFNLGEMVLVPERRDLAPSLSKALGMAPLQMDARTHGRMIRGKLAPQARIDLHGMTLAQAQPELTCFILRSRDAGLRLVLVITGKGRQAQDDGPIPRRMGALRHQVPQWLRQAPLGPLVLQVAEAHLKHGGSGAFYVYLRRG